MFKWKKWSALSALALLGSLAACGDDYLTGEDLDTDPNRPVVASRDQLFVGMQVRQFIFHEGHITRVLAMWLQQMAGTDRQYITLDKYEITESDFSPQFSALYIGGGLLDMNKIQADAEAAGDRVYLGIVQTWEAFAFGMAASIWGAIPYSDAAGESATPTLDSQARVYAQMQTLLDQAIANLQSGAGSNPGSLDLVYGGSAAKWAGAANTLKARYYLHWVEAQAAGLADANVACGGNCAQKALAAAQKGISTPANDFRTFHTSKAGEDNIWYQFYRDRDSYTRVGRNFVELLKARNDPRLPQLVAPVPLIAPATGMGFVGAPPATPLVTASTPSDIRLAQDFRQPLITWGENQLILAEAQFRSGNSGAALTNVNNVRTGAGLAALGSFGASPLADIIAEKYIVLFQNMEVWNDYKRTCLPRITPFGGRVIPGRLLYGEAERNVNPNIPPPSQQPARNANDPNACA
ncbi:MAG: SusD/RagB family nutrient-binding outer membrane lipoprotein [Gemmatimonadota bacterium]|nr:SusD/RagB family nutrient-binding outer membrane lipoprotein [Gemmatimonadota bacterium]